MAGMGKRVFLRKIGGNSVLRRRRGLRPQQSTQVQLNGQVDRESGVDTGPLQQTGLFPSVIYGITLCNYLPLLFRRSDFESGHAICSGQWNGSKCYLYNIQEKL